MLQANEAREVGVIYGSNSVLICTLITSVLASTLFFLQSRDPSTELGFSAVMPCSVLEFPVVHTVDLTHLNLAGGCGGLSVRCRGLGEPWQQRLRQQCGVVLRPVCPWSGQPGTLSRTVDTILRTSFLQGVKDRELSNLAWVRNTEHLTKMIVSWISFYTVGWIKSKWKVCQMMRSINYVNPLMMRSINYLSEGSHCCAHVHQ